MSPLDQLAEHCEPRPVFPQVETRCRWVVGPLTRRGEPAAGDREPHLRPARAESKRWHQFPVLVVYRRPTGAPRSRNFARLDPDKIRSLDERSLPCGLTRPPLADQPRVSRAERSSFIGRQTRWFMPLALVRHWWASSTLDWHSGRPRQLGSAPSACGKGCNRRWRRASVWSSRRLPFGQAAAMCSRGSGTSHQALAPVGCRMCTAEWVWIPVVN